MSQKTKSFQIKVFEDGRYLLFKIKIVKNKDCSLRVTEKSFEDKVYYQDKAHVGEKIVHDWILRSAEHQDAYILSGCTDVGSAKESITKSYEDLYDVIK